MKKKTDLVTPPTEETHDRPFLIITECFKQSLLWQIDKKKKKKERSAHPNTSLIPKKIIIWANK